MDQGRSVSLLQVQTSISKGLACCKGGSVPMEKLDGLVSTSLANNVIMSAFASVAMIAKLSISAPSGSDQCYQMPAAANCSALSAEVMRHIARRVVFHS